MTRTYPDGEPLTPELPADVQAACDEMALSVLLTPFGKDVATLRDLRGYDGTFRLFVERSWPAERILHTVRQSLADLGHPDFADVEIEPFGQLPAGAAR